MDLLQSGYLSNYSMLNEDFKIPSSKKLDQPSLNKVSPYHL